MEYQSSRSSKLSFKGDKKKSKSKHKRKHKSDKLSGPAAAASDEAASDGWVPVSSLRDLEGPVSIYFRDESVHVFSLPPRSETQALADTSGLLPALYELTDASLATAEPASVEQVFVGRRSVPTATSKDAEANMFSFKSCHGEYLSGSRSGDVTCSAAAIGPLEMWTPVLLPDRGDGAVAFMINPPGSSGDRFLTAEPDKAKKHSVSVSCEGAHIGFCQVFTAKCQAALRKKRTALEAVEDYDPEKLTGNAALDEERQAKRFQSFQDGHIHVSKKSRTELDQAKKAGRYRESLLDRREKVKSDRYCK
ncbi:hypothetical protein DL89DRAFT_268439 [Linderina pennispora]|uniref:Actin-crosslinking protein n=1 Tax=Linderina pennispora TaxID=61395 RepID=A0A1Y1W527_9FUNG|nr:uncharacterized protein DL89DRAFT_268439 [Linderina pennispora]ORX68653.1 hypothetical protein DL89DRAFT_268439 [Linderina pennispora]